MTTITSGSDFLEIKPEVQDQRFINPPQLTEFETKNLEHQYRKLQYFTDRANEELEQKQEHEVFINLSLIQIFRKLSSTIISIINELLTLNQKSSLEDFIYIFIRDDRLIYIGILLIIIGLCFYLIDITS